MGCMLFKKTTTYNAHPRVYNNTAYLHDTQLVMRNDEMYETCDIHNYYLLYIAKKRHGLVFNLEVTLTVSNSILQ